MTRTAAADAVLPACSLAAAAAAVTAAVVPQPLAQPPGPPSPRPDPPPGRIGRAVPIRSSCALAPGRRIRLDLSMRARCTGARPWGTL